MQCNTTQADAFIVKVKEAKKNRTERGWQARSGYDAKVSSEIYRV